MDRRTSPHQASTGGNLPIDPGTDPHPCGPQETQTGPTLELGEAFVKTIRHFWPDLNRWLDRMPDGRFFPYITYDKRFLIWWGLGLYVFQLAARRQLDYELDSRDTHVLDNLNRLAETQQTTRPVPARNAQSLYLPAA